MPVRKGAGCAGCPLESASPYMVPDEVIDGSDVFVLGQNPGATEAAEGKPFCGETGQIMESVFFPLAGLERGKNVSIGNTFRCRLGNTNDVPKPSVLREAADHCWRAYGRVPESTKLVVAQGAVAWNFTQRRSDLSINDWRGHLGPVAFAGDRPVYAVLHLADLTPGRNPRMTLPSKLDWSRVQAIVKGEWPRPLPPRLIVGECEWGDVLKWFAVARKEAPYIAWDTEFIWDEDNPRHPDNYLMTMVSIAYPGMEQGVQLLWQGGEAAPWQRSQFIQLFWELSQLVTHVGHNFTAELRCVEKTWGWSPEHFWKRFNDTMLAHAVLWSEFPHTLEFLESVYGQHPKIKHLPTTDPLRNWGDSVLTMVAWEAIQREFQNDRDSEAVYRQQSLKLVPIKYHREKLGISVNQARVQPAIESYREKLRSAEQVARAYVGWPINLNSGTQVGQWLYDVEGGAVQRSKNKHTKAKRSTDADAIATLRAHHLPFDGDWEANNSVTEDYVMQRIEQGAHPLLEARVMYAEAEQTLAHYLNPLVEGDETCH
jgi:uracil-DNA glycosylase family 4